MAKYILSTTTLTATSELWDSPLPVLEFYGRAAVSEMYEYVIIVQYNDNIDQIGVGVSVEGEICGNEVLLYGYNSQVEMFVHSEVKYYRIVLTPDVHMLAFSGKPRIFTNKTVMEIIEYIMGEYDLKCVDLSESVFTKKTYCVQYNQTDWEFIQSLLAEIGLLYTFRFSATGNVMVIFSNTQVLSLKDIVSYYMPKGAVDGEYDDHLISGVGIKRQYTPTGFTQIYNNYQQAGQPIVISSSAQGDQNNQLFTSGGGSGASQAGMQYGLLGHLNLLYGEMSAVSMNTHLHYRMMGMKVLEITVPGFVMVGTHFSVKWNEVEMKEYVALEVEHVYTSQQAINGSASKTIVKAVESNVVVVSKAYPKPVIPGVHRGIVVCPNGKETYTDQWGNICVRFFWSNEFVSGDTSMDNVAWVRPSYAGATDNGFYYLPRNGDEVLVGFEDGDPERPYMINALYNSVNGINHNPEQVDINYWRMAMTGGDDTQAASFNQISFNADPNGAGVFAVSAFNNYTAIVQNNWTETVVNGNWVRTVSQGNWTNTVSQGNWCNTVSQGNWTNTIGGNKTESVSGSESISIGDGSTVTISGGKSVTITSGDYSIKVADGSVKIEALTEISLKAPLISIDAAVFSTRTGTQTLKSTFGTSILSGDLSVTAAATNVECAELKVTAAATNIQCTEFSLLSAAELDLTSAAALTVVAGAEVSMTAGAAMSLTAGAAMDLAASAAVSIEAASMEIAAAAVMIG